ncbi:MAG: GldG family protein [Bryobacterales bacterium]|nr:GldG family protein [Bryobacterales bacterium]
MAQKSSSFFDKYWRESRQNRYGAYLTGYLLVVLLLLGGLNYLGNRFNKSFDSTVNQRYTLSDQTTKVAAGLTEDVRLRYFDQSANFVQARDLLSRYDDLSTRIRVDYVDIDQQPQEARAAGVTAMGEIVLSRGDRFERASALSEEEITRALVRLVREGGRKACVLQGSGEAALDSREPNGFSNLSVLLQSSSYELAGVNPLAGDRVEDSCTVVIVAGPQSNYPAATAAEIERFAIGGGGVLLMLDPPGETQGLRTEENTELVALAKRWGVEVSSNVLLSQPGTINATLLGPLTLVVNRYESHPITSTLADGVTVFPEARSLVLAEGAGSNARALFSSAANSFAAKDLKALEGEIQLSSLERGPFVLAAAGQAPGEEGTAAEAPTATEGETPAPVKKSGRFVVVGNSKWAANGSVGRYENRNLLVNMINWLAADEELISIPPKPESESTIVLSPVQLRIVNLVSLVGVPLLVVLAGVLVWLRRR